MGKLKDREINYLGALLHDIGKLVWRAQPVMAGKTHEILGEEFIRQNLGKIEYLKEDIEEIIKAASRKRGKIWLADVFAAGERQDSEVEGPRRYLQAITNRVDLSNFYKKEKSQNYFYFKPCPLSIENLFPIDSENSLDKFLVDDQKLTEEHNNLLTGFVEEIKKLHKVSDFNNFITTFYKLLEKYTSRVLSAGYLSHPDISLFDHSRLTAALAICLEESDSEKQILLLKGDITGIQDYIYGEVYKIEKIAKRLRARSFYIQLLLETISKFFIDELKLFPPNILYIGGGHFILIVPNNEDSRNKIKKLEKEISSKLILSYYGKISYVQAVIELTVDEFINNFEESYNKLESLINQNKKQKNLSSLNDFINKTFEAKEIRDFQDKIEEQEEKLGQNLVKAKWIIQAVYDPTQSYKVNETLDPIKFEKFHTFYFLIKERGDLENVIVSNSKARFISVLKINDSDFIETGTQSFLNQLAYEFRFIGNYVPTDEKSVLSFEDIAKYDSENYPLLGVLRMDIDSLGAIFRFGLKENDETEKKHTPSRIAYLSRELNLFFTWYINELAKKHQIYIAYSGGDDVFVVGSWYRILCFAKDIREDFKRFSSKNDYLSISGGIVFTKPNFPISQSAKLAGEQESIAKKTENPFEKDRIGIFDISFTWEDFEHYMKRAEEILKIMNKAENESRSEIIPRSFIHSLLNLTKKSFTRDGKINVKEFIKSRNKILYQFARRGVTNKVIENDNKENGKETLNQVLYELAFDFIKDPKPEDFYKKFQLTATIVLYKTRR